MAERSRRYPQRPVAFWTVLGLVAALGVAAVAGLALSPPPAPLLVAG